MPPDPRQRAYEAKRRQHRIEHPPIHVVDGPPALILTPPPDDCERCGGKGQITYETTDNAFRITCPSCGGKGLTL